MLIDSKYVEEFYNHKTRVRQGEHTVHTTALQAIHNTKFSNRFSSLTVGYWVQNRLQNFDVLG